ncbi:MAG TPA: thiol reductase thioredoxin [Sulfuricurvum sp.]|nr:thiol reductase thioredoxin [Sulfuricurvum sp.]
MIELTDTTYTDFISTTDKPVFIDFYSPTCGPCQQVLALLPHLENYFGEEAAIAKVDVSRNPKLAAKYEIRSVPFCVSVGAKDKMVKDYELGAASTERYISMIKKAQGKGIFARLFGK